MQQGKVVLSSNRGRFALGSPDGMDLTSGCVCEIKFHGRWVKGRIEHGRNGYYFLGPSEKTTCLLMVGMLVRVD